MSQTSRVSFLSLVVILVLTTSGCKREPAAAPASNTGSSASSAQGASATGPGSVVVNDKQIIYQNLHIKIPWEIDPAKLVNIAQEAATGNGLSLNQNTTTLKISSDGQLISLNNQPCGTVKPGDQITLQADGKLFVNSVERKPNP